MAGDAIEHGGHHLCLLQPSGEHELIDYKLVHGEVPTWHTRNSIGQVVCGLIKLGCRHHNVGEPPGCSGAAINQVASKHHLFGTGRTDTMRPHRRGRAAPHPGGHVADAGILSHHQQIAT